MNNTEKIKELKQQAKEMLKAIEKLEQPKPQLEVGRWYRYKTDTYNFLYFITKINKDKYTCGYGFGTDGSWDDNSKWCSQSDTHIPATDKEIETALISEAKKRGFKEGVRVITAYQGIKRTPRGRLQYYPKENRLKYYNSDESSCYCVIFYNGKWAEIIEDEVVPLPTINGYELEIKGDIITCGCVTSNKYRISNLYNAIKEFNQGNSEIDFIEIDGYNVTPEKLEEIVKYLNKKQ